MLLDLFGNPVPDAESWDKVVDGVYWDFFAVPVEKLSWFMDVVHM